MKLFVLFAAFAAAAAAQNWPAFRGANAGGSADGAKPPVSFDGAKTDTLLWKTPIPGIAHSSPSVWGDRVFITTSISSDPASEFRWGLYGDVEPAKDVSKHVWKVYCLDRKTGAILWERTAHEGNPKTKKHPKSSQANATPATDGTHVVVSFASEGVFAYDFSGKQLWKLDLGSNDAGWFFDPDFQWGAASSPVIHKGRVILQWDRQKDSFIASYDIKTGKEIWRTARKEIPTWGTPTIYEGEPRAEIITNGTKAIRGYDPATGKELWTLGPNSEITATTPVIADGLVIVANGYPPVQPIYAIKPGGSGDLTLGAGKTTSDHIAWSTSRGGVYMPTPLAYQGILYLLSNNGILTAYRAKTGERIYQQRLGGSYSASPVAADGRLYLANEDGGVLVAKAGETYELLATNAVGEVMMATPAIVPGALIIRAQKHVFAFGQKP